MRIVFAALFALIAGSALGPVQADPYRWCARYSGNGGSGENCYFLTLEQCRWAVSGVGGYCALNQFYDALPLGNVAPPRNNRRR